MPLTEPDVEVVGEAEQADRDWLGRWYEVLPEIEQFEYMQFSRWLESQE